MRSACDALSTDKVGMAIDSQPCCAEPIPAHIEHTEMLYPKAVASQQPPSILGQENTPMAVAAETVLCREVKYRATNPDTGNIQRL